jgi:uncharacterized protein (DUF2225 family)
MTVFNVNSIVEKELVWTQIAWTNSNETRESLKLAWRLNSFAMKDFEKVFLFITHLFLFYSKYFNIMFFINTINLFP